MSTNSNVMNQSAREHLLIQQQPTLQPPHHEPIVQQLPVQQSSPQKPLVQPFSQQQGIILQRGLPQSQQFAPIIVRRPNPYQMHAVAVTETQATPVISQRTPSQEHHQLQPIVNISSIIVYHHYQTRPK